MSTDHRCNSARLEPCTVAPCPSIVKERTGGFHETEADTPLIVDPNAHLSYPISFQNFEPIARSIRRRSSHRGGSLCYYDQMATLLMFRA
jgi:hypothetical protein